MATCCYPNCVNPVPFGMTRCNTEGCYLYEIGRLNLALAQTDSTLAALVAKRDACLFRAAEEIASLRAVVEAAEPIVRLMVKNWGESCPDELDNWDAARAKLKETTT